MITKTYNDGSKTLKIEGVEIWLNPASKVLYSSDWSRMDELTEKGYFTRKFYRHLHGHVERIWTGKLDASPAPMFDVIQTELGGILVPNEEYWNRRTR